MGSYVARIFSQSGTEVQVVDNNSTGLDSRVLGLPSTNLELSDTGATAALQQLTRDHKVTAVVHLAALKRVGEGLKNPKKNFLKLELLGSSVAKIDRAEPKTTQDESTTNAVPLPLKLNFLAPET